MRKHEGRRSRKILANDTITTVSQDDDHDKRKCCRNILLFLRLCDLYYAETAGEIGLLNFIELFRFLFYFYFERSCKPVTELSEPELAHERKWLRYCSDGTVVKTL